MHWLMRLLLAILVISEGNYGDVDTDSPLVLDVDELLGSERRRGDNFCLKAREDVRDFLKKRKSYACLFSLMQQFGEMKQPTEVGCWSRLLKSSTRADSLEEQEDKFYVRLKSSKRLARPLVKFCARVCERREEIGFQHEKQRAKDGSLLARFKKPLAHLRCRVIERLDKVVKGCQKLSLERLGIVLWGRDRTFRNKEEATSG